MGSVQKTQISSRAGGGGGGGGGAGVDIFLVLVRGFQGKCEEVHEQGLVDDMLVYIWAAERVFVCGRVQRRRNRKAFHSFFVSTTQERMKTKHSS